MNRRSGYIALVILHLVAAVLIPGLHSGAHAEPEHCDACEIGSTVGGAWSDHCDGDCGTPGHHHHHSHGHSHVCPICQSLQVARADQKVIQTVSLVLSAEWLIPSSSTLVPADALQIPSSRAPPA